MDKRGISNKQRAWLVSQLADWQSQQVVSADQAGQILGLYASQTELDDRRRSVALLTLMGVAAFLVGLGALLLVAYNWGAMSDEMKLVITFAILIAAHTAAFVLRFKRHAMILSEVLYFLGCASYGAGIFLVAQIFHLNAHYPDGIWWWALGVLPFALCLDTPLLHVLLVGLLGVWCGTEMLGFSNVNMWIWGAIPRGAYTLPLLALPGMVWAYRKGSVATVSLYVALLGWWAILQPFAWNWEEMAVYLIGAVGGLMLVIAECHSQGSRFAIPYRLLGVLLVAGTLLQLSFYDFNDFIARHTPDVRGLIQAAVIVVLAAAISYVTAVVKRRNSTVPLSVIEQLQQIARGQWLFVGLVLLMGALLLWQAIANDPLLPTIAANVGMIVFAIWLIAVGLRENSGLPFAGGVVYLLLWAVVRYVDLFGDFGGMLGAAVIFFFCGGVLFGVAFYWHRRRRLQHV